MVVDTSALLAIALGEADSQRYLTAINGAQRSRISVKSVVEASMVFIGRKGTEAGSEISELIEAMKIEIVPFTRNHMNQAVSGFRRFGKGRHPANLNFGDCCSYALAKSLGQPLLFKGNDFVHTDIEAVRA